MLASHCLLASLVALAAANPRQLLRRLATPSLTRLLFCLSIEFVVANRQEANMEISLAFLKLVLASLASKKCMCRNVGN